MCFRIFSQLSNIDLTSSLMRVLSVYAEVLPSLRLILSTSPSTRTGCIVIRVKRPFRLYLLRRLFLPQLVPRWTAVEKGAAAVVGIEA